ncbi:MAG: MBL fold metallo-hydrolase, partial [Isosphaeraceae bacterium]
FHGATRQITGSAHLLEIGPYRLLLDCGLFDSDRIDPNSPNRQLSFDPRALDAVIVSHAHNDHIGRLPFLVKGGYNGPIYTTPATAEITSVMLRDSARIQREEVRNAHLRHPHIETPEPLFDLLDVEWVVELIPKTAAAGGSSSPATWAGATPACFPTRPWCATSTSLSPRAPTATASSTPTTA